MHPHLTLHRHPMCAEIIEEFQKCHVDHPLKKFFGECTDLKIKLDRCFRQEVNISILFFGDCVHQTPTCP
ncbi:COX assembly mitochondrial protein 2 homolog isoform X2 [Lolium rigidum]|nr:COX assembly mitochondrial protein 2 homolog isoform X2 [Lolium rigidum]